LKIDGVPGTGAPIELIFRHVAGTATGTLLPTGSPRDTLVLSGGRNVDVSVVDAGNVYVFVEASRLGVSGEESPHDLESHPGLVGVVIEVLETASELVSQRTSRPFKVKKLALVAPNPGDDANVTARIFSSNGRAHKAYAVTGAISTAFAASVSGVRRRGGHGSYPAGGDPDSPSSRTPARDCWWRPGDAANMGHDSQDCASAHSGPRLRRPDGRSLLAPALFHTGTRSARGALRTVDGLSRLRRRGPGGDSGRVE
jgi:hypothetical protein